MSDKPKIVVFACNWSVYPGLQLSVLDQPEETDSDIYHIISVCSGRVSPELVIEAFSKGAWGVMIAGCPPDECEHDGNYKTRRRFIMLRNVLQQFDIEPERIKMDWFSKGEVANLNKSLSEFESQISELGPAKVTLELG